MGTAPTIIVNYAEAAHRHLIDGEFLYQDSRIPNAGHHFGFQAECGLKAMLCSFGASTTADGDLTSKSGYRKHIDELAPLITSLSLMKNGRDITHYVAMLPSLGKFSNWKAAHRYWSSNSISLRSVNDWRNASNEISKMLDQAKLDGVLI
jgi:hypothetical protein